MPSNTLVEKSVFPCESVPEEEIYQSIVQLYTGTSDGVDPLKRGMVQIPTGQVTWFGVTILHVLGSEDSFCNTALEEADLTCGAYVNRLGNILLLVHPNNDQLLQYLQLCKHGLHQLYIFNSEISSLSGLGNLSQLTSLELYFCRNLKSLPGLENLSQLTSLKLSECWGLTSLPTLKNLASLTSLDLYECNYFTTLPGLENLASLVSLSLSKCRHLTSLPGLKHLTSLTSLKLKKCEKLTSLPGLENLTQLTSLELYGLIKLTSLPRLENLTNLTSLKLYYCHNIRSLLGLESLSQLTSLVLSYCNNLTSLPNLKNLSKLTSLDLYKCEKLTTLPGLDKLSQLTSLNLSWCENLTSLPMDIHQLKSLRYLNLQNLQLRKLPDWLPEIAERFTTNWSDNKSGASGAVVNLCGTTVDGVDMSIFSLPHEMVLKWFEERKAGRTQALNEMKVIFLGDGEAGKSYTISRLMNNGGDPLDYEGVRTPGIAIKNHPCKFGNREFTVNYWDFGGQEIMHAMHRVFLTNRTMYVVLVSVEDDDYQERAEYWLRNIKSFASDAPVLLAFNKIDMRPRLFLDEKALRTANGNLKQIVSMSAQDFDQQKFDSEFRNVLLQEIVSTGTLDVQWPKSWIELKSRMEAIQSPRITVKEYTKICKDCQVEDVQIELLHWFHDLGVSFCFRNNYKLKNQIILQPRWITNGIYIILFNECKGVVNGIVPHESIHELLEKSSDDDSIQCTDPNAEYEIPRDAEYVLGIMRQFDLSLQVGEGQEFIPMLCQPQSPLDLSAYEADEDVLEFHMTFEYLPNNVLHRLMVNQYSELDLTNIWRSGARFCQPGTDLSAVVSINQNTLKFFISHTDSRYVPQTYLTVLKAKVDQIWQNMGLPRPEESFIYKIGKDRGIFGSDELEYALENSIAGLYSRDLKRSIPISDLLSQFGLDESVWCESSALRSKVFASQKQNTPSIDEQQLLEYLVESCRNIQADHSYGATGDGSGKENQRNRRIRDDLKLLLKGTGYHVSDQSERGFSKSGQSSGELDILLEDDTGVLWTVIEALRIHSSETNDWSEHLARLLGNYNYAGLRFAYLVTYVDANEEDFLKIWKDYQEYIPAYSPGRYIADKNSFKKLNTDQDLQYIKKAMCSYTCVSAKVTVYHLFVMVKPQPPKPETKPKSSSE